ncbi:MAG TPA: hypothetical protein DCZ12_12070 [Gammaproteobacteria bacterium]|nr:hypothetical protein [Gammaproteobacteria bacterium]
MSMTLMVEAMQALVGHSGRKLVLIKLADNANDDGVCWPSYQNIADHCEMGRSTVKQHIKTLEKDGFLTVAERNGGRSSNKFQLHIGDGKPQDTRSESDPVRIEPGQDSTPTRSESDPHPVRSQPPPGQDLTPEPVIEPISEPVSETVAAAPAVHDVFRTGVSGPYQPPEQMTDDWEPSDDLVTRISNLSIPEDFIRGCIAEFRVFWLTSDKRPKGSFDVAFLKSVQWQWNKHQNDKTKAAAEGKKLDTSYQATMERLFDTSWA